MLYSTQAHGAKLTWVPDSRSENVDLEGEFEPSLLNSAVYLLQLIQEVSTFAVNYQGRPFRESIRENRPMYYALLAVAGVAFACSTEFIPEVNEKLRLVKFSASFKTTITLLMAIDFVACYVIEHVLKYLFSDYRPKDIALRRPDQLEREKRRHEHEAAEKAAEKEREKRELQGKDLLEKARLAGLLKDGGYDEKKAAVTTKAEKVSSSGKDGRDGKKPKGKPVVNGNILR